MEHGISTPSMFINSLCTGVLILFGELVQNGNNIHLPPIIIEVLQVCSYAGAFAVSLFTIYNFFKKRKKNSNSKES